MHHSRHKPPKIVLRFFRWYCDDKLVEDIEGDLMERFETRALENGHKRAKRLFIKDVLQLFRPGIIKSLTGNQKLNSLGMIKNNIIVAKRQLLRNKMYSTIKIGGFALGISVCLLISLFIRDELSYDKHIPDHQNLYRLAKKYNEDGNISKYTWFQAPFAQTIINDFPEVTLAGRTMQGENMGAGFGNIRKENEPQNHYEDGFIFADQAILDLFQFPTVYGNLNKALSQPFSLVMTQRKAEKLFPGENPIGQIVILNNNTSIPYTISAVIENLPENSFLQFNYMRSLSGWEFWSGEQTNWQAQNYQVFAKVKSGSDLKRLTGRLEEINTKYMLPAMVGNGNVNAEDFLNTLSYVLQPVTDIHLKSADVVDVYEKSDIKYVWIFGIIAIMILSLACINFVNLSTAKSANRAKEVGLRKTIGSYRSQLINQFLTESTLYSLLSFALALGLASLILPFFNQLAAKNIIIPWTSTWFIPTIVISAIFIGVFAGIYPAFYLSSFKPASVLKGRLSIGSKNSKLRNSLVVFQFMATIILMIGTFVVYKQMDFILNTKTGFEKDQVIILKGTGAIRDKSDVFKSELLKIPEVLSSTVSGYLPVSGTQRDGDVWWNDGKTKIDPFISAQIWTVDHDYLTTLGIKLHIGRDFDRDKKTDQNSIIINQAMAKELGIVDNPINAKITRQPDNSFVYNVIGVVEDFNYELLTQKVEPLAMRLGNNPFITSIKVDATDITTTLAEIESLWNETAPNQPFVYEFLDQNFERMYVEVQRIRNILSSFAILAIVIACLGLFGLSVFMIEQRTKEISVRLVLGAKAIQIVKMLSSGFIKPILIALALATPIAWFAMKDWLNDFQFRIDLGAGIFIIAWLSSILIALITISFQSLKAAYSNPVAGLRGE